MSRGKRTRGDWGFQRYRAQAAPYPPLSRQEERDAFTRMRSGVEEARTLLAMSNLRLVLNLAAIYRDAPVEPEELVQAGCVGLMEALDRFNPNRGVRFSSYAQKAIRGAMRAYLRKFASLERASLAAEEAGRLSGMPAELPQPWQLLPEVTVEFPEDEILGELDRPAIRLAIARALYWLPKREHELFLKRHDLIHWEFLRPWARQPRTGLLHLNLTTRKGTLGRIGRGYNISAERVRQVYNQIIRELRDGPAGSWLQAVRPPEAGPYHGPDVFFWARWAPGYFLAQDVELLPELQMGMNTVMYARTADPHPADALAQISAAERHLQHHGLLPSEGLARQHDPRRGMYIDLAQSWTTRPESRPAYRELQGFCRTNQPAMGWGLVIVHSPDTIYRFMPSFEVTKWEHEFLELGWVPLVLHPFGLGRQRDRVPGSAVTSCLYSYYGVKIAPSPVQSQLRHGPDRS